MTDAYQRAAYESEIIVALGPFWSAVWSGFAVVIGGHIYITPAGERYLEKNTP